MRQKVIKDTMLMILYQSIHFDEFQEQDKLFEKKEGIQMVDRHFRGAVTRARKANSAILEVIEKQHKGVYIKMDKESVTNAMEKLVNKLNTTMMTLKDEKSENTINFDEVKIGLPKGLKVFLSGVLVCTNLFNKRYINELEGDLKKAWITYTKRVDKIAEMLLEKDIIWYEEEK